MILCWFYKKVISHSIDAKNGLPEQVRNHCQHCASCRTFFEFEVHLVEQLIAHAPRHRKTPSPFLHAKIMAAIGRAELRSDAEPRTWRPVWSTALGLLGLVLIFSIVPDLLKPSDTSPKVYPSPAAEATSREALPALVVISDPQKLREWGQNWDQPLETELNSVVHDAKQALHLLAHNFLPDQVRASLDSSSVSGTFRH